MISDSVKEVPDVLLLSINGLYSDLGVIVTIESAAGFPVCKTYNFISDISKRSKTFFSKYFHAKKYYHLKV